MLIIKFNREHFIYLGYAYQ